MGFTVEKLHEKRRNGIRITGLTPEDISREDVRQQLRDLWVEHGLIHFRCEVSPEFHVALSEVFGPLEEHPVKEYQLEGNPKILNVTFDPNDTDIWEVDGKELGAWTPWHSDLIFMPKINHGGILRAQEIAAEGGGTSFIDKIEAYDTLPDDIKAKIDDLDVVYRLRIDFRDQKYVPQLNTIKLVRTHKQRIEDVRVREDRDYPPVVHPLVFVQPETGRKALNLSPSFVETVCGMDPVEADELLSFLTRHIVNPDLMVHHHWTTLDEMVLWDNWRFLHQADGVPAGVRRVVYRTTIAGDYAKGKSLVDYEADRAKELAAA